MSDDDHSDSSSDGEDIEVTGLIATRQKRATAGNLYATLRANLDDEELQKELLAEDEEGDAADYEGSDKDEDDDDALESSSDDEDAGPPKEGEAEELEGEKALKRQERAEAKKKRKVADARLRIPALQRMKKRVKLADDAKTEDGSASEIQKKPKKKSERANWLPTAAEMPTRQSHRAHAVANREIVHANLQQSAARSEKQRRVMKDAAARERSSRWMDLTQEARLEKCKRIEKETAKEFGQWERAEEERQRARDEAIAAKRRKVFDGPVISHWSGSVLWVGEKVKIPRLMHGSVKVEEVRLDKEKKEDGEKTEGNVLDAFKEGRLQDAASGTSTKPSSTDGEILASAQHTASSAPDPVVAQQLPADAGLPPTQQSAVPAPASVPWLQGIENYAAQPDATAAQTTMDYTPSTPAINTQQPPQPGQGQTLTYPPLPHTIYPKWPHSQSLQPFTTPHPAPPPPPAPLLREQATRTLLILSSFPTLAIPTPQTTGTTGKRGPYKTAKKLATSTPISTTSTTNTPLDPTPLTNILLPSAHPAFTAEESRYLLAKPKKAVPVPPPPSKARCAMTMWPAKFRDPKTGIAYADLHQYKAVQRVVAGSAMWSGLLGAWVGPRYGEAGRPARGVPEGFAG